MLQDLSPLWFLVFRSLLQKGDTFNTFTFLLLNSMGIKLTFLLLAKHLFLPVVLSGIWPEGMGEWHKLPGGITHYDDVMATSVLTVILSQIIDVLLLMRNLKTLN